MIPDEGSVLESPLGPRVLVVCKKLSVGGVPKSLVNLLGRIQGRVRQGTLVLPSDPGPLVTEVPPRFKVVQIPSWYERITSARPDWTALGILARHPLAGTMALGAALLAPSGLRTVRFRETLADKTASSVHLERLFGPQDIAIQYIGGFGAWDSLVAKGISAPRKILWIHGDLAVFGSLSKTQRRTLQTFDRIVAVSQQSADSIVAVFPELADRVVVLENSVDKEALREAAQQEPADITFDRFTFCSASRLVKGKAFDVGMRAAKILKDGGAEFRWLILGSGPEAQELARLRDSLGLQSEVRLLGAQQNPAAYIARSDTFLHTSKSEGKSVSVQEALALGRPVVATEYPSVRDQLTDGVDALIAPLEPVGLAAAMHRVMADDALRSRLSAGTQTVNTGGAAVDRIWDALL